MILMGGNAFVCFVCGKSYVAAVICYPFVIRKQIVEYKPVLDCAFTAADP